MRLKNSIFITLNTLLIGFWLIYAFRKFSSGSVNQFHTELLNTQLAEHVMGIFDGGVHSGASSNENYELSMGFFKEKRAEANTYLMYQLKCLNQTVFSFVERATDDPFLLPLVTITVSFLFLQMLYTVYKHCFLKDKDITFKNNASDNYVEILDIIDSLKNKFGEKNVEGLIDRAMQKNAKSGNNIKAFNHYLIQSPITCELMTNPCRLIIDGDLSRNNFDFHSLASWFEVNPQQSPDGFLSIQENSVVSINTNYDARDEIKRFLSRIEGILEKKFTEHNNLDQKLTRRR